MFCLPLSWFLSNFPNLTKILKTREKMLIFSILFAMYYPSHIYDPVSHCMLCRLIRPAVLLHLAAPNRQISMTETWENLNLQNFAGCPLTPLEAGTIGAHVSGFGAKNVSLFFQEVFLEWPLEWNLWHCHLVWCSWAHHLEFVIWPLIGRNTVMSTNS